METQFQFTQTVGNILCCMCGTSIPPNPANMCVNCIRGQVDITDGIPKQVPIFWCSDCGRYLNPPTQWLFCELESKELLAFCLKKIKGLSKVKLVDASFVWTEPHSRRIKVKATIQKEVFANTILQQAFVVEYVVNSQMCSDCQKREAKHTWVASCQVRQKVDHKKTFYYLEQLILKHSAHEKTINIKERPDGLDFFFGHRSHAMKMIDFLGAIVPIRSKASEQLISQDDRNNTYVYKYTFSVEIAPICREDLICLPHKLAQSLGGISPLLTCFKVSTMLHLIDPYTLHTVQVNAAQYWANPFNSISGHKQLIEYTVLDINLLGPTNSKFMLAEATVARSADFGYNDTTFLTYTHLGHILKPGDTVLGYDLSTANFNDADISGLRGKQLPDVMLIKKCYPTRKKNKKRHWRLKTLTKEEGDDVKPSQMERDMEDYQQFIEELEEDKELRAQINLYKAQNAEEIFKTNQKDKEEEMEEADEPEVGLEELLEDLQLEDD